ncbi:cyclophilin-like fold protein [Deinococcus roseus]|uniref:Cyclophilin-like domain-containing protein n=1 Tax=Deinococcus roseus TaxID=392414 RepID=A0ABQ2DIK2_9DEIO|nr:cyclophilin-like fold protein [Deinococcus roseus]GGJ57454.1 hypothetical protein GCM10008938_49380 [Deinococcus roseus]
MKIQVTIAGTSTTATLQDHPTAQDFLTLLPLTVSMKDMFAREKVLNLSRELSAEGPKTQEYQAGDIIYWPPGPNLALLYRKGDEPLGTDIIPLGVLDSLPDTLLAPEDVQVTFERLD